MFHLKFHFPSDTNSLTVDHSNSKEILSKAFNNPANMPALAIYDVANATILFSQRFALPAVTNFLTELPEGVGVIFKCSEISCNLLFNDILNPSNLDRMRWHLLFDYFGQLQHDKFRLTIASLKNIITSLNRTFFRPISFCPKVEPVKNLDEIATSLPALFANNVRDPNRLYLHRHMSIVLINALIDSIVKKSIAVSIIVDPSTFLINAILDKFRNQNGYPESCKRCIFVLFDHQGPDEEKTIFRNTTGIFINYMHQVGIRSINKG